MPYKIKMSKDKRLEQAFQHHFKKIGEGRDFAIYECDGDIWISPQTLGATPEHFLEFYKALKVYGGRKELQYGQIHIAPSRKIVLSARLSDGEFTLLKNNAGDEPLSQYTRSIILPFLQDYLYQKEDMMKARRFSSEANTLL